MYLQSALSRTFGYPFRAPAPRPVKAAPPATAFRKVDVGSFSWERRDCAVRSMVSATGKTYEECHAALKAAGRRDKCGTSAAIFEDALGLPFVRLGRRAMARGLTDTRATFAAFVREHRKGTYIVFVTGHFFALVDGVHLDMCPTLYKPRARVSGYWQIA